MVTTRLDRPAYETQRGQPVWQDKLQQFCWHGFFSVSQQCEDLLRHSILQQSLQDEVQPGTFRR